MNFGKVQSFLNEIKHSAIPVWFLFITPVLVLISIPIAFSFIYFKSQIFRRF